MQDIVDFLNTSVEVSPGRVITYEHVPEGWQELVELTFALASALGGTVHINKIAVDKGLLRVGAVFTNSTSQAIFDKFAQAIAKDSATMCMKCGGRGFRRKEDEGWPSLCGVHYVEYVNFLDSSKVENSESA